MDSSEWDHLSILRLGIALHGQTVAKSLPGRNTGNPSMMPSVSATVRQAYYSSLPLLRPYTCKIMLVAFLRTHVLSLALFFCFLLRQNVDSDEMIPG